jgi:hypothetical protein
MADKPKMLAPENQSQIEQAEKQFDQFKDSCDALTLDRMNAAPKQDLEPQTKLSQKDKDKLNDVYLKPSNWSRSPEKFNERFREEYNFAKEYVQFIAEHNELKGDTIELWTKPFPGVPAEFWKVPSNRPVWGPRYLAERLTKCQYHRLKTENKPTFTEGGNTFYGDMVVDTTINRIDARPVSSHRSIFMGAGK